MNTTDFWSRVDWLVLIYWLLQWSQITKIVRFMLATTIFVKISYVLKQLYFTGKFFFNV